MKKSENTKPVIYTVFVNEDEGKIQEVKETLQSVCEISFYTNAPKGGSNYNSKDENLKNWYKEQTDKCDCILIFCSHYWKFDKISTPLQWELEIIGTSTGKVELLYESTIHEEQKNLFDRFGITAVGTPFTPNDNSTKKLKEFIEKMIEKVNGDASSEPPALRASDLVKDKKVFTIEYRDDLKFSELTVDWDVTGYRHFPIVSNKILKGIVSLRDILRYQPPLDEVAKWVQTSLKMSAPKTIKPNKVYVKTAINENVLSIASDATFLDILKFLYDKQPVSNDKSIRISSIPVTKTPTDKEIIGVISYIDVLKILGKEKFFKTLLGKNIKPLMLDSGIRSLEANDTLSDATDEMSSGFRDLPILNDDTLIGAVTDYVIYKNINYGIGVDNSNYAYFDSFKKCPVNIVMHDVERIPTVSEDAKVSDVIEKLCDKKYRMFNVVYIVSSSNAIQGLISYVDVLEHSINLFNPKNTKTK